MKRPMTTFALYVQEISRLFRTSPRKVIKAILI